MVEDVGGLVDVKGNVDGAAAMGWDEVSGRAGWVIGVTDSGEGVSCLGGMRWILRCWVHRRDWMIRLKDFGWVC